MGISQTHTDIIQYFNNNVNTIVPKLYKDDQNVPIIVKYLI